MDPVEPVNNVASYLSEFRGKSFIEIPFLRRTFTILNQKKVVHLCGEHAGAANSLNLLLGQLREVLGLGGW